MIWWKQRWMAAAVGRGDVLACRTGNLSPHYWCLLDKLALGTNFSGSPGLQSVEVMRSLEEAEDWEKLEVWIVVVWQSLPHSTPYIHNGRCCTGDSQVTLATTISSPKVERPMIRNQGSLCIFHKPDLWRIYKQVQKEQLPLQSPTTPVSFCLFLPNTNPF
jgi:hypothetical protein